MGLDPEWIGVRLPFQWTARERRDRLRLGKPNKGIELLRQMSVEVMALPLSFGAVDNADGALQPAYRQPRGQIGVVTPTRQRSRPASIKENPLP